MEYGNYQDYLPSRSGWYTVIPSHWIEKRLKLIAKLKTGKTPKKSIEENYGKDGFLWVKPDDLKENQSIIETKEYLTKSGIEGVPIIPAYSPLVCCIGTVGKFGFSKDISTTNQQINAVAYDVKEVVSTFGIYLASANKIDYERVANKTVVSIVNTELQGQIICPLPPLNEQQKIAAFLDYKTQQIDQLIEKKKALIEKLEEKRIAVITQAVTKGLDKNVKLKPSGVDCLGDVPAHWLISKLRWFVKVGSGDYLENTRMEDRRTDKFSTPVVGGNGVMAFTIENNTSENSLVVGRVGAHCGNVHLIREKSWVTDNALRVGIIDSFNQGYLYWLLKTMKLNDDANKNAQPLITGETVKARMVSIPPIEEQKCILRSIEEEILRLSPLKEAAEKTIEKLQEYRSAIITSAVTGKIDVREVEIPKAVA